ncbi:hypothetical protein ACH40E_28550 [Streptomyces acidicola]|uniref:hypothetical protein n=1 Tax=Streptomyces acidicola TaxID=2596892 RepID=UPI0037AE4438
MKVTRIAYAKELNQGKCQALAEQAWRLGGVRTLVWDRFGSLAGVGLSDRVIRDAWMADGTASTFGVGANAWKETVRDAVADIRASREAAKVQVRRAVCKRISDKYERKRLFGLIKNDGWRDDSYLSRLMRRHWKRGGNHAANQIVVRADKYRTFVLSEGGDVWLSIPGLPGAGQVRIPLNTSVAPTGTLRLILRGGRVEVHFQIDASVMRSSARPHGAAKIGVDKGYTEVLVDSEREHHGRGLGRLLAAESDHRKVKNQRRSKLRVVAERARDRGDHAKADRIWKHNLGTLKRERRTARFRERVRTLTYEAVHSVVDKAHTVVAEDLSRSFSGHTRRGREMNRRLAAWTRGLTAQALHDVSERRGSALVLVNAAYTSQVDPVTNAFAVRRGDRLHCSGGVVWQVDEAAAVNILQRDGDPDITLFTPHQRVRQILQERIDRQRTRLPVQDSNVSPGGRGERSI